MSESTATPRRAEIGAWISRGWDWFIEDLIINLGIGLAASIILTVGNVFLVGPVLAGLALAAMRKATKGQVVLWDFFDGFRLRYLFWSSLAYLLIAIFSLVGLVFLIVPGLVIFGMYVFTFHFIVADEKDFWQAMESSRRFVSQDYFGFTLFAILMVLLNGAGLAFFGIGTLVTLPLSALILSAAVTGESVEIERLEESPAPPPVFIE